MYHKLFVCDGFTMWQRMALVIAVMLLGFSGGVLALFLRGMHAQRGAAAGLCSVSALAIVQGWMIASGIAKSRKLYSSVRDACYRGAEANFRAVFLVGLCAVVGVFPMAVIGESSGAEARFATVMLGGVVFSTAAALTVLPVVIVRIAE